LNINPTIEILDLQQMVVSVMSTAQPLEKEVADKHGNRYRVRILPYKTLEGSNQGVVVTIAEPAQK
jgi:hypothetical protein